MPSPPLVVRIFSDYLCPWSYVAVARLHTLQAEYTDQLALQWRSFLLFREDAHKGWNSYVAAHWQKAQEAEPALTFIPWRGAEYPTTTMPAHIASKAVARQGVELFDIFHREAMPAFFSLSQNLNDPAVLRRIAHEAGTDLALCDQDSADPALHDLVWQEFTGGVERDRVIAIPTMFIGQQRVVEGALSLDRYRQAFDTMFAAHERLV